MAMVLSRDLSAPPFGPCKEVCVVFFDVRKAFDSVPHIPLLQKLEDAGLDPFLLRWIRGYLTDRQQSTVVDGYSSTLL